MLGKRIVIALCVAALMITSSGCSATVTTEPQQGGEEILRKIEDRVFRDRLDGARREHIDPRADQIGHDPRPGGLFNKAADTVVRVGHGKAEAERTFVPREGDARRRA